MEARNVLQKERCLGYLQFNPRRDIYTKNTFLCICNSVSYGFVLWVFFFGVSYTLYNKNI
ncbi:hypothetical protein VAMP_21n212 [Candidatus Vampirococcus lugosii]|uniref:Uncharacterized protein n=1 Tax=Candidatus Vampirococcus lugosii TaxID=2789015 RepID=A0ABS5QKG1_9BACT|nr:hypothetical protein [Candidatus Vampirococcus lugosii]